MSVRLTSVKSSEYGSQLPFIHFNGQWLADCGFESGKKIIIEEQKGLITIKLVEHEEA